MKLFTLLIALLFLISPFTASELNAGPGGKKSSPGWQKGSKDGWKSDTPPQRENKQKQKKHKERPQGWDKGKKEGWTSNVPPGQEGKYNRDPRTKDWKVIKDRRPWLK